MENVEKGKKLFLTVTILFLAISLIITIFSVFSKGILGLVSGLVRVGLEGMLLYYTFKGKKWAKIALVTLVSIVILIFLLPVFLLINTGLNPTMQIIKNISCIILLAINGFGIYVMAFSSSFNEYLKSLDA